MFCLHDEIVGISDLGSLSNLLVGSLFDSKGDIITEGIVEEDGLLVHIANELAQVLYAQILHIDAIDEYLTLLNIIVTGNEVNKRRLAGTGLSYDGNGLALWNSQVDMFQNPLFAIAERDIAEGNLTLEGRQMFGTLGLLDGILGHQNLVDALHRGKSLGDVIACTGELLQGVDDGIEDDHVVDEDGTSEDIIVQHQNTSEP